MLSRKILEVMPSEMDKNASQYARRNQHNYYFTFLITQETNIYGAIVKSNRQFQRFGNLPKFIYSDSFTFSFSFSGHQQVSPQLGSCPMNVQYCNMTQELLRNHIHSAWQNDP